MRFILTALVTIALPALAAAQSAATDRQSAASDRPSALGPIGLPLPAIGLPLAPIGLPLAPIGLGPEVAWKSQTRDQRSPQSPHQPRPDARRGLRHPVSVVYFISPYYVDLVHYVDLVPPQPAPVNVLSTPPSPPTALATTGALRLELETTARGSQVYVDGFFVGTLEDVSGQLQLESGPHQIEVRAERYDTLVFGVKIVADRSITYRGTLTPIDSAEPLPSPAATIYFIPGCYLGNVPPQQAALPATCDLSRLSTYKP